MSTGAELGMNSRGAGLGMSLRVGMATGTELDMGWRAGLDTSGRAALDMNWGAELVMGDEAELYMNWWPGLVIGGGA